MESDFSLFGVKWVMADLTKIMLEGWKYETIKREKKKVWKATPD